MSGECSGRVSWFYRKALGRKTPFQHCCVEHDLAYEEGGSSAGRRLADKRFRQCLIDSGRPVRAWIFWLAVRLFGGFHWG